MTRTPEDLCTFVIISRSILLGMRNVSEFTVKIKYTFDLFVQSTNKCTINWQFIILFLILLLLNVSTQLCHLQGGHGQYLLSYISMSI